MNRTGKRSGKTIKAWCRARGITFAKHMSQYPLLAGYYDMTPPRLVKAVSPANSIINPSIWTKIKDFICQLLRIK